MTSSFRGTIVLELMIAFAVFAVAFSAAVLLAESDASAGSDLARMREMLEHAQGVLAGAQAYASRDFASISSTTGLSILDLSPCLKLARGDAQSSTARGVERSIGLAAFIVSTDESERLGNDCAAAARTESEDGLTLQTTVPLPAEAIALDTVGNISYVGLAAPPFLAILEGANSAAPIRHDSFENGFALPAQPNDLDAILLRDPSTGDLSRYVFAALDATTTQLAAIDATDPAAPILTALRTPLNVDPAGSFPQGHVVRYYGGIVYLATRETSGRELHAFDASDPAHPYEIGAGTKLGITVNDFAVRDQLIDDAPARLLFAAAARNGGELAVYDASAPAAIGEIERLRTDLPGEQDGLSLALLGSHLYLGRAVSSTGPELYRFDVSDLDAGIAPDGTAEIGGSVRAIRASGNALLLLADRAGKQLQLWHSPFAGDMTLSAAYSVSKATALDSDGENIQTAGGNDPSLFTFSLP